MITLLQRLSEGKTIRCGQKVRLPIDREGWIYGFSVYSDIVESNILQNPPLGQAYVVSNRLTFCLGNHFGHLLIFTSMKKCQRSTYPIFHHFIPQFFFEVSEDHKKAYMNCVCNEVMDRKVLKLNRTTIVDDMPHYIVKEDDYVFDSDSKMKGIGNQFVVIVRRIAPETGTVVYESYNPKEIELIGEEDQC